MTVLSLNLDVFHLDFKYLKITSWNYSWNHKIKYSFKIFLIPKQYQCCVCLFLDTYCPISHPWAYNNGMNCCKYIEENVDDSEDETCDGSVISFTSSCCKNDHSTSCPTGVCKSMSCIVSVSYEIRTRICWSYL